MSLLYEIMYSDESFSVIPCKRMKKVNGIIFCFHVDFKPPELWMSNLWAIKCSSGKACKYKSALKHKLQTKLIYDIELGQELLKTPDDNKYKKVGYAEAHSRTPPTQPQTEFLLFVFYAVSLVPPSGCLGLRGNPLYLHSVPHVLVVVLTVKIQDSLPTPSCRQLFLSSMWVSNIWTANPAVDGWMNEEDGNAVLSGNKTEVKIHQELHCLFCVYKMLHPHHQVSL